MPHAGHTEAPLVARGTIRPIRGDRVALVRCPWHIATGNMIGYGCECVARRPVDASGLVAREEELDAVRPPTIGVYTHSVPVDLREYLDAGCRAQKAWMLVREASVVHFDSAQETAWEHLLHADHAVLGALGGVEPVDAILCLQPGHGLRLRVPPPGTAHGSASARLPREVETRREYGVVGV